MSERANYGEAIRELFRKLGGFLTISELATRVLEAEIYPDDYKQALLFDAVKDDCRTALKTFTYDGMPFAKPTGHGAAPWKQLDLFSYGDWEELIGRTIGELMTDYALLQKYQDYCMMKFNKAPAIPELRVFQEQQ